MGATKKQIKAITFILGILAILVISGCTSTGQAADSREAALAQCLTDKGVKMYGADWCSHCNNQKSAFGDAFQYINYVECTEKQSECDQAGIQGYPTWIINGIAYPGEKSLGSLASLAGCSY